MNILFLMICIVCHVPFSLVGSWDLSSLQKSEIHPDFMYLSLPIPDACLEEFFTDALFWGAPGNALDLITCYRRSGYLERVLHRKRHFSLDIEYEECPIYRKWEHLGSLPGNLHVVLAHRHEKSSTGYFDGLMIVQRRENELILKNIICCGDRWAGGIGSCTVEENKIRYSQLTNSECLLGQLLSLFPDLKQRYEARPKREACSGQYGEGSIEYEVLISPEGTTEKITILSFEPSEDSGAALRQYRSLEELRQYLLDEFIDDSDPAVMVGLTSSHG
ncbi:MAG: hypothetical protein WCF65_05250, partial [Parachlamydiaceae bacterium]